MAITTFTGWKTISHSPRNKNIAGALPHPFGLWCSGFSDALPDPSAFDRHWGLG